ncbi:FLYWCH-type zinc finger-containing protein 1-like [Culex pipiens pallens]|uniref:FLYWCH-type zinc finger-containing protein 1-like n=1 Tax=Culex pipiens pallens TaxID=42434 RepID=UPI0022AA513B|nr:FLYWCH-type zinc finger-containing protein 1-like [Culex pipiens pallens]
MIFYCRKLFIKEEHVPFEGNEILFVASNKGKPKLLLDGYPYLRNNGNALKTYWIYFHLRLLAEQLKQSWSRCQFRPRIVMGRKGRPALMLAGYCFTRNNSNLNKTYWLCAKSRSLKCRARIITIDDTGGMILKNQQHNHPPVGPEEQFSSTRKYKELIFVSGQRGTPKLIVDGYSFIRNKGNFKTTYWRCSKLRTLGCKAKVVTNKDDNKVSITTPGHCHMPDYEQYT